MRTILGILIVVFVGVAAFAIRQRIDSNAASMAVGVLFGVLSSLPMFAMVAAEQGKTQEVQHHHTHDVTVRIIPSNVQKAMAQYGADDAVRINGQWLLLDGDSVVSSQRLLAG